MAIEPLRTRPTPVRTTAAVEQNGFVEIVAERTEFTILKCSSDLDMTDWDKMFGSVSIGWVLSVCFTSTNAVA